MNRQRPDTFPRTLPFILQPLHFAVSICVLFLPLVARADEFSQITHYQAGIYPRGTLYIDTRIGDVRIEGSKESGVEIEAEKVVNAGSEAKARRRFDQIRIELKENSEEVFLRTIYPPRRPWRLFRGETKLSANFRIRVPYQASVALKCVDGDVTIRGVGGRQEIRVSYGDVEVTVPAVDRLRLLSARSFLGYVQSDLHGEDAAGFGRGIAFWNPTGEQEIRIRVRMGGVYVYHAQ
ncbi:MAG: hypothetical protein LAN62_14145 [Acidobacteriia bacterium]|nr:hypothetical protein [Terriglobia bacterium]